MTGEGAAEVTATKPAKRVDATFMMIVGGVLNATEGAALRLLQVI